MAEMRDHWRVTTLETVLVETDNVVLAADIQSASNPLSRSRDGIRSPPPAPRHQPGAWLGSGTGGAGTNQSPALSGAGESLCTPCVCMFGNILQIGVQLISEISVRRSSPWLPPGRGQSGAFN